MKIKQIKFDEEKTVLIGMVVDEAVLSRIATKWKPPMFESTWSNKVGQWCIDYFMKYKKAPGKHIQTIYDNWCQDSRNTQLIEPIGQFLDSLSKQYEKYSDESNPDYIVDVAGSLFNKIKINKLIEDVQNHLEVNEIQKAEQKITGFAKVEMGVGECIKVFEDADAIREAFEEQHDPLIKYTGGLGKFFSDRLERDGFIAILGPDKRGKSFWLMDMAFRAVLQKRRVAFFECGDLSKNQIMRRFMTRVSRHPVYPSKVYKPSSFIRNAKDKIIETDGETIAFTESLTWRRAYRSCKKLLLKRKLSDCLRLTVHFNSTLSVADIRSQLDEWERDGWIPDVIAIDYADILNMDYYGLEGRDRIDRTWKEMRRLSQEKHCLVLTATQSDAEAYEAITLGKAHFSEDKRKNAHVTGMIGLNQTPAEKLQSIIRLNWIVLREGEFNEKKCCYVGTCFKLANMAMISEF